MEKIKSEIIGVLNQDDRFEDWWKSSPIKIPFFDYKELDVVFIDLIPDKDETFITEADEALKSFLEKSSSERLEISNYVFDNCEEFLEAIGYDDEDEHLWQIKDSNKIWEYVYPNRIYISRRSRRDKDIYLNIACRCDWEQEHGLQLIFRKGKQLTRVSGQDGHLTSSDAYATTDEEDFLLSQYKE
ncbi:hypothetical protein [Maribacter sp.]|uniref:DUF6985 domain-containing protein n=1 Tax=Maribacter sp. TaxID=1897614 RepID=UPI0032976683